MKTKICSKCKIEYPIYNFEKHEQTKDGLRSDCKICRKIYKQKYYQLNKEQVTIQHKKYRKKNRIKIKEQVKQYYEKNREIINKRAKQYYKIHKEEQKKSKQQSNRRWSKRNKEHINEYKVNRRKSNLNFKLACYLRIRINKALKQNRKLYKTKKLLGCSIVQLKQYLESKFKKDMSWANYGKWHIDHIRPCASFDLSKPSEQRKCFHYINLQPLWWQENLTKGVKTNAKTKI